MFTLTQHFVVFSPPPKLIKGLASWLSFYPNFHHLKEFNYQGDDPSNILAFKTFV